MAKKNSKKSASKFKKAVSKKAAPKKKAAKKRASPKKAESAKQARIEMEFIGSTDELGKLLFALFQAHELKTGDSKEIAQDAKIELLPMRMEKGAASVVVRLTIGLDVPEGVASEYLWHKCEAFSNSREVKILVNRTE